MRGAALAVCAALAGLVAGCGTSSTGGPALEGPPPDGAGFTYHGLTHVSWWHDAFDGSEGREARQALAETGVRWAGLLVTWYMDERHSSTIAPDPQRSPSDDTIRRTIDEMHALGLEVMLKPHVDVQDGTWRAQIAPQDTSVWFESYAAFIDHYAAIAAEKDVVMLCIGTELASMSGWRHAGEWALLVERVRGRYPGLLTYAANAVEAADELTSVSFWSRLDLIGADAYTPLTDERDPTRQELAAGWRHNRYGENIVAALRNVQQAYGKPLILTEIGYRSVDGANRAPWDYVSIAPVVFEEQADCYAALYEVFSRESAWMRGVFWWAWDVDIPPPADTGFNPRGKPAEDVLRDWQGSGAW